MFQGFSQEAVDFLWGIRFNNERGWFEARKEEYLTLVAGPMRELGEQVHAAVEEEFPKLGLNLHVSRIYRDARRLHGRGPYKDHLWFTLRRPKEEWVSQPAFYFELAPEYYSMGMGWYDATPLTMAKLRARIDRDPKAPGAAGPPAGKVGVPAGGGGVQADQGGPGRAAGPLVQPEEHRYLPG